MRRSKKHDTHNTTTNSKSFKKQDDTNRETGQPESNGKIMLGIIVVSFLSVPICYFLSYLPQMADSLNVFLYSAVICCSIVPLTYFTLIRHLVQIRQEVYFYVFTIFAFTAIADLLLALTLNEYSSAFHFYLEQGEVYLKTAHGMFINYWDGSVQYSLYLIMLYCMLKKKTHTKFYRFTSLFWCGSIINSLIVLLGGAAVGQFGSHIKPSYLLNVPYALFPVLYLFKQLRSRNQFIEYHNKQNRAKKQTKTELLWIFDGLFIIYFVCAIGFSIFRLLHALKTPVTANSQYFNYEPYMLNASGFSVVQILVYAFYFVPFYCGAISSLLFQDSNDKSKYRWLPDWAAVHAGAAAQAQFSYFASSLYNPRICPDPSWSPIPIEYRTTTITINVLLALVPQLFAGRILLADNDQLFY